MPKKPTLVVERVPIGSLTPDSENARKHSQANLDAIAGSLRQFGQRRPLVVWGDVIIAGNGTVEAAKSLGWEDIDVTRVPGDWSHDQARAYALADNRTAELAEWDADVLASQLIDLDSVGYEIGDWGFEPLSPPKEDEWADALQDPASPKSNTEQITFYLTNEQAVTVRDAVTMAKSLGDFPDSANPNSNGNAISRICETFQTSVGP